MSEDEHVNTYPEFVEVELWSTDILLEFTPRQTSNLRFIANHEFLLGLSNLGFDYTQILRLLVNGGVQHLF